jgi:hypothetical protein
MEVCSTKMSSFDVVSGNNIRNQKKIEQNYELWTTNFIKDELTFQLSNTKSTLLDEKTDTTYTVNKYHKLAEFVLWRINIYRPPPEYLINRSDLTPRLQNELEQLYKSSPKIFEKIVTESVQTILEAVNQRYYHVNGAQYKVRWRFVT